MQNQISYFNYLYYETNFYIALLLYPVRECNNRYTKLTLATRICIPNIMSVDCRISMITIITLITCRYFVYSYHNSENSYQGPKKNKIHLKLQCLEK